MYWDRIKFRDELRKNFCVLEHYCLIQMTAASEMHLHWGFISTQRHMHSHLGSFACRSMIQSIIEVHSQHAPGFLWGTAASQHINLSNTSLKVQCRITDVPAKRLKSIVAYLFVFNFDCIDFSARRVAVISSVFPSSISKQKGKSFKFNQPIKSSCSLVSRCSNICSYEATKTHLKVGTAATINRWRSC